MTAPAEAACPLAKLRPSGMRDGVRAEAGGAGMARRLAAAAAAAANLLALPSCACSRGGSEPGAAAAMAAQGSSLEQVKESKVGAGCSGGRQGGCGPYAAAAAAALSRQLSLLRIDPSGQLQLYGVAALRCAPWLAPPVPRRWLAMRC